MLLPLGVVYGGGTALYRVHLCDTAFEEAGEVTALTDDLPHALEVRRISPEGIHGCMCRWAVRWALVCTYPHASTRNLEQFACTVRFRCPSSCFAFTHSHLNTWIGARMETPC